MIKKAESSSFEILKIKWNLQLFKSSWKNLSILCSYWQCELAVYLTFSLGQGSK